VLVHAGVKPSRIRDLADLVDPVLARKGLGWLLDRQNGATGPALADLAILLKTLVRHHVPCSFETRRSIEDFARRLAVPPQKGLSLKNRERLRAFEDEEKLRRLITLPQRLFNRCTGKRTQQATLLREEALAIAILQCCPLRRKNLVGIHLLQNLRRMGDGRVVLVFEAGETKTRRPLEFELPTEVVRRLDEHLALRSPTLCPAGVPWLFPRRDGSAPMDPSRLSSRISGRIRKETGLEVHPHLFRHLCAHLWLRAHPGRYEDLRRLLGHSQLSSTLDVYAGLEAGVATRAYADLIAQVVEE
jgi:integrase